MKLSKAIKVLNQELDGRLICYPNELREAQELGVKALKAFIEGRKKPGGMFFHTLLGETEE